jgi:hypothetical protein
MDVAKFSQELEALEKSNKKNKCINIVLGVVFIVIAYGIVESWEIISDLHLDHPILWAAGLGGGLIGDSLRNWKGSKELNLLKKILKETGK